MSESVLVEISTDKPELDCKLCYLPAQTEDSKIQVRGLRAYSGIFLVYDFWTPHPPPLLSILYMGLTRSFNLT